MTVTHLISELLDAVGDATTPSPAFWGFKVFLLKKEISDKALSLRIPDQRTSEFVVETDASNTGTGACLFICIDKSSAQRNRPT